MKNIVICCDGTGNEISENISNVLKLYRCLRKTDKTTPHQAVFYDPGVGTLTQPDSWHRFKANFNMVLGLATGYGLDDNVINAYRFLATRYQDGDRIFLFGFSRGAYTVRALAGLIHKVGLISPDQINLAGSGLIAYKKYSSDNPKAGRGVTSEVESSDEDGPIPESRDDQAAQFARITSTRWPTIHFVGVWDTVASVIVPRTDRLFALPSFEELAFTIENPSVNIFRQAAAMDERRCMFRLKPWNMPQTFASNRFNKAQARPQDTKQVWFAGVHCDVGGGYPEAESAASKYPLLWMIDEAVEAGLAVNPRTVNQLAWGVQRKNSPFQYVAPSIQGALHDSMTPAWRPLEYLPKKAKYKEWPARKVHLGCYIPNCEPRFIPEGAIIHESVLMRIAESKDYRPVNLPATYERVPLPVKQKTE
ncbi:T6SS phospholipase effector Tle1-like catalytic domain-containing protein [Bradyrhizobium sp. HKCCYLS20291]|uniref:T6SS phospholipase effector Tle1-like catalytic domain-containing protein n=1 Tax=Bradyrhizobium sp. HKCCYLS20291 TaxID=3420766 RepID=UPI003EC043ED